MHMCVYIRVHEYVIWSCLGESEQGGGAGGIGPPPHSKIWVGGKYVLPPHEMCIHKLYIY